MNLLEPLLDDFQYWFEKSRSLLELQELEFLGREYQADLLSRVKQAQQEVSVAKMLLLATDGQVGVETGVMMPWHQLVAECWKVGKQFRSETSSLE
ncbi:MAG: DUF2605 domain-containing protein [Leptolyngbyaceae cyanobacterium CSU_1_4]|nr:DUF2605 domain-containing protein [Leptolyngbyaceae cyanobacterium CSU_1_4]